MAKSLRSLSICVWGIALAFSFAPQVSAEDVRSVAVSPDGAHVYAVREKVFVYKRNLAGGLDLIQAFTPGSCNSPALPWRLNWVAVSPDGTRVYTAAYDGASVFALARDNSAVTTNFGKLTLIDPALDGEVAAGKKTARLQKVNYVAVSPDNARVYAGCEVPSLGSVVAFASTNEGLRFLNQYSGDLDADGANDTMGSSSVAISPDGRNLYVTAANANRLLQFGVTASGDLDFHKLEKGPAMAVVYSVAISPDGRFVYAASSVGLNWFSRDTGVHPLSATYGDLTHLGIRGVANLAHVILSHDDSGKFIYLAVGGSASKILVYARDPDSGAPSATAVQTIQNGTVLDGIPIGGLSNPYSLAIGRPDTPFGPVPHALYFSNNSGSGSARVWSLRINPSLAAPITKLNGIFNPGGSSSACISHDTAVFAAAPHQVNGAGIAPFDFRVRVQNRDGSDPAPHMIRLAMSSSCPASVTIQPPDFPGLPTDSIALAANKTADAVVHGTVDKTMAPTPPYQCELKFTAFTTNPFGAIDPTPANNEMTMVLQVN